MADVYEIESAIQFEGYGDVTVNDVKIYSSPYADYTIDVRISTPYSDSWTARSCADQFQSRVESKLRSMGVSADLRIHY